MFDTHPLDLTRRHFFGRTAAGIGAAALGSLLNPQLFAEPTGNEVCQQLRGRGRGLEPVAALAVVW